MAIKAKKDTSFILLLASLVIILSGFIIFRPGSEKLTNEGSGGSSACKPESFSEIFDVNEKFAFFEGKNVEIPVLAEARDKTYILGATNEERWVEVDISDQKLRAWEGGSLFLETAVSTGLPWYPTPMGEFRVQYKVRATKMEGGSGRYYYYLPNVPYVMFFGSDTLSWSRGYGLHGTYWHNDFGTRRSHGCVNLPTSVAEKLYYWTSPIMPEGKSVIRADAGNLGTRVIIHD